MVDILPDSRLHDPKGTVMVNVPHGWKLAFRNGCLVRVPKTVRLELEPIFCINCGAPKGYVPRGLMAWVAFLCDPCSDTHGAQAAVCQHSDDDFWAKVREEMIRAYGYGLTFEQLNALAEQGKLSPALQLLQRESPYKNEQR